MKISAIIAHTFCLENYGEGDKPYWKRKGGDAYWIANFEGDRDERDIQQMALNMPVARTVETRDSSGFIEMIDRIEVITVEEARKRAAVNRNDPDIDCDTYFSFVEVKHPIETYRVKAYDAA